MGRNMKIVDVPVFAAASLIGRSHLSVNGQCEDAWASAPKKAKDGNSLLAVAVSDGAGSKAYGRIGASIAVRIAAEWLVDQFELLFDTNRTEENQAGIITAIGRAIRNHIRSCNPDQQRDMMDYSCTLLAVVVDSTGRWVAAHLGDGGIVGLSQGQSKIISAPSKGEFANSTFFVTEKDAQKNIRFYTDSQEYSSFGLFTDGLENALLNRQNGTIAPAMSKMLGWLSQHSADEVTEAIKRSLESSFSTLTTDDCTLALICLLPK